MGYGRHLECATNLRSANDTDRVMEFLWQQLFSQTEDLNDPRFSVCLSSILPGGSRVQIGLDLTRTFSRRRLGGIVHSLVLEGIRPAAGLEVEIRRGRFLVSAT